MFARLSMVVLMLSVLLSLGCSSTMNEVNKGAEEVGKAGGQVIRVPGSVSEGAAEGIAGEEDENPYDR